MTAFDFDFDFPSPSVQKDGFVFFLLQCSEWGVVIPKEILLTV